MAKIHKPLNSFNPKLIAMLLKASLEPITLWAEDDKSAPHLYAKTDPAAPDGLTVVTTRWHKCRFTSSKAAERFRDFVRMSVHLHLLRAAMRAENHPDTIRAYSVRISVDDRTGSFTCAPSDTILDEIINELDAAAGGTSSLLDAASDPLSKL